MPPYPGFCPPSKPYQGVSQWQGKEMRGFQKMILPALASALRNPSASQAEPFRKVFQCVRALNDWGLVAQYRSHNELKIDLLDGYLRAFHRTKDIFRKYRANRETERLVAERRKELRKEYNAQLAALEESSTQRRRFIAGQRLNLQAETDDILCYGVVTGFRTMCCGVKRSVSNVYDLLIVFLGSLRLCLRTPSNILREESDFNFPKLHLMSHFTEHIRQYGNISDNSTESCETAHKDQLKIPYRRSNRVNPAMQILRTFNRDYIFAMHGLNLLQIARDRFFTSDLVDNLKVLEPHLKRKLHHARRELANPQDDPAIQVGLIAPLGRFPKEEPVEKCLVKTPIDLTVVKSVNISGSSKSLEFYIR
ncbi:hypothetical protein DFP73DRAFT_532551 [Morchella snyderi]|nr:hypothetical protein DFP73DRAFT_532551 [Morchella snyderi]